MSVVLAWAEQSGRSAVLDLVILLAAAAGVAMLLRRASLATIPSFLICGALIGPSALGLIASGDNIQSIGQIAVVMLMFTIGLHMDMTEFSGGMVRAALVGVVSTAAAVAALLPVTTASAEHGVPAGLAVAIALAMSSTAVVMRIVTTKRDNHKTHGRIIFATLVIQDLIAIGGLALIPVLAAWAGVSGPGGAGGHGEHTLLPAGWPTLAKAAVAVVGIATLMLVAHFALPRLLTEASRGTGEEVPLVLAAAAALGCAVVASGLGFSPELGAFLAGFILAGTPFRFQLAGQLTPMRDLFMAVFFTAVGLKLDLRALAENWQTVSVGLVAVLTLKAVAIAATAWMLGATAPVAAVAGLALCQAGEFTIVLLSAAAGEGLIAPASLAALTCIVVLSLTLTPTLYSLGHRLAPLLMRIPMSGWTRSNALREMPPMPGEMARLSGLEPDPQHNGQSPAPAPTLARYVIIAGFGVVGRALADRLEVAGVPFCVVDLNQNTIATQRRLGRRAVYGDVTNPEVLHSAGIEQADAVLVTIPDDEATLRACAVIRQAQPAAFIAARTSFLSKAMAAAQQGADHVTIEEVATAEAMARQVMDRLAARAGPRPSSHQ
ncbi:MAG: cation:proton antiporter [Phycisphaerae bacterium]|nr:cation:proton antiporter [Phycisphaerae bacterium]